jgi:hypothetical protein
VGILHIARLPEAEYEAIRDFVHRHPTHTYDKWLKFQAQEIDEWKRGDGNMVVLVDINFDEITRYCRDTGARRDVHLLKAVATAKAVGKFK